jgi:hypothetical protein
VLVSDREAEHIPGCNMAFRRDALPRSAASILATARRRRRRPVLAPAAARRADRLSPGAMDWHHRRNSLTMYWRQQRGYGKAEALLEQKWPERYSSAGHLAWAGRLYGRGFALPIAFRAARVYGGVWGSAAYQSLYQAAPPTLLAWR